MHNHLARSFLACLFAISLSSGSAAVAAEGATTSPRDQLASVSNYLEQLPADWPTTMPIQLEVAFNLKYPANSPEAEQFIDTYQRSISALPDRIQLRVYRTIAPMKYRFMASLAFRNWSEYRTYESSAAFLKYYREQWRPAVAEIEERLYLVDPVTGR